MLKKRPLSFAEALCRISNTAFAPVPAGRSAAVEQRSVCSHWPSGLGLVTPIYCFVIGILTPGFTRTKISPSLPNSRAYCTVSMFKAVFEILYAGAF